LQERGSPISATRINHVSVSATDLTASVRFYTELFGMRMVPNPDFGFPVAWLAFGEVQIHLFEREVDAPRSHHVAIEVDDMERVIREVKARGIADTDTFGHWLYRLPDGAAQLYLRDPGGNLIEVDHPDADSLDPTLTAEIRPLRLPQEGPAGTATLWVREPRTS
jgi:lactoylglutathione lyase